MYHRPDICERRRLSTRSEQPSHQIRGRADCPAQGRHEQACGNAGTPAVKSQQASAQAVMQAITPPLVLPLPTVTAPLTLPSTAAPSLSAPARAHHRSEAAGSPCPPPSLSPEMKRAGAGCGGGGVGGNAGSRARLRPGGGWAASRRPGEWPGPIAARTHPSTRSQLPLTGAMRPARPGPILSAGRH